MKNKFYAIPMVFIATLVAADVVSQSTAVNYPEDYRKWTHVRTILISEESPLYKNIGGIHHVYANDLAISVLQGQLAPPYPDGSTFVYDLLAVQTKDGSTTEGARKSVGVIVKNTTLHAETGGWGFAQFVGDTRTAAAVNASACFGCHQQAEETGFVFTEWRQ